MRSLYRGLRNVWRNRVRTAVVLLILGLASCLALVMLAVEGGVRSQVAEMESSVGTLIEARPVGTYGMMSLSDELLPETLVDEIAAIDGVAEVSPYVMTMTRSTTSAGSSRFAMGVHGRRMVFGVQPGRDLTVLGGGRVTITAGRSLEPGDEGQAVVVVGSALAEAEAVWIGDALTIEDQLFVVVGIHESDQRMAAMSVFMPQDTARAVFNLDGLTQIFIRADSIGRVDDIRAELLARWGENMDVVTQKDTIMGRLEDSLSSLTSTSRLGLLLSLIAAGAVVFGTMFLVVRERSREIGILKAIGAGRSDIALQFGAEAVALSLIGALVGLALLGVLGSSVASMVMGAAGAQAPAIGMDGPGSVQNFRTGVQGFMGRTGMGVLVGTVDVSVTWILTGWAVLGGILLGLAGGLIPSLVAAGLKPAEVIRND